MIMMELDAERATAARARQLEGLDRLAQRFGQSLTKALAGNLGAGRQ